MILFWVESKEKLRDCNTDCKIQIINIKFIRIICTSVQRIITDFKKQKVWFACSEWDNVMLS